MDRQRERLRPSADSTPGLCPPARSSAARRRGGLLEMREAADVAVAMACGGLPPARRACGRAARRRCPAAKAKGPRGAATQVRIAHRGELIADTLQQCLHLAADLLAMLQGAGRVERHAPRPWPAGSASGGMNSAKSCVIAACALLGAISRIGGQQVHIILHRGATAAGGHHDRFGFRPASVSRPVTIGHQASISARMSSWPASWYSRWKRTAPQHPAPALRAAKYRCGPARGRPRLDRRASDGCTQPRRASMRRAWCGSGHEPAGACAALSDQLASRNAARTGGGAGRQRKARHAAADPRAGAAFRLDHRAADVHQAPIAHTDGQVVSRRGT